MNEEVEMLLMELQDSIDKSLDHFVLELQKVRAGKAAPEMLNSVQVEAYGVLNQLNAVASVSTPDARTLVVTPFDKSVMSAIERAIINSNLGLNPMNDGNVVRISIPPLTSERRQQLVKMAKGEMENARVALRSLRKSAMEDVKKLVKDGMSEDEGKDAENQVQKLIDEAGKKIEELFAKKEKDILTV